MKTRYQKGNLVYNIVFIKPEFDKNNKVISLTCQLENGDLISFDKQEDIEAINILTKRNRSNEIAIRPTLTEIKQYKAFLDRIEREKPKSADSISTDSKLADSKPADSKIKIYRNLTAGGICIAALAVGVVVLVANHSGDLWPNNTKGYIPPKKIVQGPDYYSFELIKQREDVVLDYEYVQQRYKELFSEINKLPGYKNTALDSVCTKYYWANFEFMTEEARRRSVEDGYVNSDIKQQFMDTNNFDSAHSNAVVKKYCYGQDVEVFDIIKFAENEDDKTILSHINSDIEFAEIGSKKNIRPIIHSYCGFAADNRSTTDYPVLFRDCNPGVKTLLYNQMQIMSALAGSADVTVDMDKTNIMAFFKDEVEIERYFAETLKELKCLDYLTFSQGRQR